ncbi:MAG: hypothetical protein IPJ34_13465 [Myxococcales bacterium]|nr:hypothetical protein [Myxococcales bacterium]
MPKSNRWGLALATLLVLGCRRKEAASQEVDEKPAASAEPSVDPRVGARETLASAAKALVAAADRDLRLAAYRLLSKAVHDAKEVGVDTKAYEGSSYTKANETLALLDGGDTTDTKEKDGIPTVGEKPVFAPPKYDGTFFLGGVYRGPYDGGGIVVESNGKYYIINNADKPLVATYLSGYVVPTGTTVTLALGTAGREADSGEDERQGVGRRRAQAPPAGGRRVPEKTYTEAAAAYQKDLAANQAASAKYKVNHDAWVLKRAKLIVDLDAQILAITKAGAGAVNAGAVSGGWPPLRRSRPPAPSAVAAVAAPTPVAVPAPVATAAPAPCRSPRKTPDPLAEQH